MPVRTSERISAGPPTRGSSIVLISCPFREISGRWGPRLYSPLRNFGNNFIARLHSKMLNTVQARKMSNNQSETIITPNNEQTPLTPHMLKRGIHNRSNVSENVLIYKVTCVIFRVLPGGHPRVTSPYL